MCWEGGRLVFHQKGGLLLLLLLFWREEDLGFVSSCSSSSFPSSSSGGTELVVVVIVVVGGLGMSLVSRRCRIWSRARSDWLMASGTGTYDEERVCGNQNRVVSASTVMTLG